VSAIEVDHKDPELKIIKSIEGMDRTIEVRYPIDGKENTISSEGWYDDKI